MTKAASPKCPKNPTKCSQLKACPREDSWQINFDALDKLRSKGCETPLEWRDRMGKSVNTGGAGGIIMTARQKPDAIPSESNSAGGGSGGGGGGGGGGGQCPGTQPPPLDKCHMEGEQLPLKNGSTTPECGASVQLSSQWLTLVKNANAATFIQKDEYDLKAYRRNGSDYRYAGKSTVPSFYCKLKEIPGGGGRDGGPKFIAEKIKITPLNQYNELSDAVQSVAIAVTHEDGSDILPKQDDNFIIMKRSGSFTFRPPTPNPGWFTSKGARNVDPNCYTIDQLLDPIPNDFGDVRFRNVELGYCGVDHIFPLKCPGYTHYVDLEQMQMLFSENQPMNLGAITGSDTFSTHTVAPVEGSYEKDPTTGAISYSGTSILMRGGNGLYIGSGLTKDNEQAFLGGASIFLYNGHIVRINQPGRINMQSNGNMQLIDGGTIETVDGVTLRSIAPMAFVNFKESGKPMQPLKGYLNSEIKVSGGSLIPTAKNAVIQLPFNTAESVKCYEDKNK